MTRDPRPGHPLGQAEAVHRQTEGNPLFVQEVLRYLVEEGLVEGRAMGTLRTGRRGQPGRTASRGPARRHRQAPRRV